MRLKDKVALITGAGSGMGRATAILFAREGARVAVVDIDVAGGEETVRAIRQDSGTGHHRGGRDEGGGYGTGGRTGRQKLRSA
jgi:NAD(P)-dependent dehydrogenase (short-subunit alcohol dehydrogenase family)